MTSVDIELIQKARGGSESAFATIVSQTAPRVFSLIRRLVSNPSSVEDLAQEVFIRTHRNLSVFAVDRPLEPWLYRVALNLSIDYLRKESRRGSHEVIEEIKEHPSSDPSPETLLERKEVRRQLEMLINRLPGKQRRTLVLRDVAEFSVPEIALILRCGESTVRVHLARARLKMRNLIEQYAPGLQE